MLATRSSFPAVAPNMNIPIKHIAVTLGLILGFAAPPANAESIPPLKTAQPPQWVIQIQMAEPIVVDEIKPLEPLKMADFKFSPPRTFGSSYPTGQCTWLASTMKGNIPNWGNANKWDDNARASGKTVSTTPVVGSVAQTDRGYYGHVAVVVGVGVGTVTITEGNYDYNGSIRTHTVPTSSYVYIYL